jgi:hypothetical protein
MAMDDPSPAAEPTRWRFQFSLRTLFIVMTLWAVLLGWWSLRRKIHELDVVESYSATYDSGSVCILCESGAVLGEKEIAHSLALVSHMGRVNGIIIAPRYDDFSRFPKLTSSAWGYIRQLNLKSFSTFLTDESDMPQLEKMSSLKELSLHASPKSITPKGLKRLQESLPNCRITAIDVVPMI